jgi:hypothetical protein
VCGHSSTSTVVCGGARTRRSAERGRAVQVGVVCAPLLARRWRLQGHLTHTQVRAHCSTARAIRCSGGSGRFHAPACSRFGLSAGPQGWGLGDMWPRLRAVTRRIAPGRGPAEHARLSTIACAGRVREQLSPAISKPKRVEGFGLREGGGARGLGEGVGEYRCRARGGLGVALGKVRVRGPSDDGR